jgi:DME family drug/metabolite transporter
MFARGLRLVSPSHAVSLSLAEPLTAGVLGILLVGETLTLTALLGIVLLLGSLVWLALG